MRGRGPERRARLGEEGADSAGWRPERSAGSGTAARRAAGRPRPRARARRAGARGARRCPRLVRACARCRARRRPATAPAAWAPAARAGASAARARRLPSRSRPGPGSRPRARPGSGRRTAPAARPRPRPRPRGRRRRRPPRAPRPARARRAPCLAGARAGLRARASEPARCPGHRSAAQIRCSGPRDRWSQQPHPGSRARSDSSPVARERRHGPGSAPFPACAPERHGRNTQGHVVDLRAGVFEAWCRRRER